MNGKVSDFKEKGALKTIRGYLTTPEIDIENERVSREAYPGIVKTVKDRVKAGKPVPLFIEHRRKDYSLPVGKILDAGEDSYGCWFKGVVSDTPVGTTVWELAKEGILYGISIGGDAKDYRRIQEGSKNIREIVDLEFREASFTGLPVNPGSYFEIAKSLNKQESSVKAAVNKLNDSIDSELSDIEKSFSDRDLSLLKSMGIIKSIEGDSDEYVQKVKEALQNLESALNFEEGEADLNEKLDMGEQDRLNNENPEGVTEVAMKEEVSDNPNTPQDESKDVAGEEKNPEDLEYLKFLSDDGTEKVEGEDSIEGEEVPSVEGEEESKEGISNLGEKSENEDVSEEESEDKEGEETEEHEALETPEEELAEQEGESEDGEKPSIDKTGKLQSILNELVEVLKDLKPGSEIGKSMEHIIKELGGEKMNYLKCANEKCTHSTEMFEKSSDFVFNFCPACGDTMVETTEKSADVSAAEAKQPTGDKPALDTDATGDKTDVKKIDFEPESTIAIAKQPTGDKVVLKDLEVQTGANHADGSSINSTKVTTGEEVIPASDGAKSDKEDSTIKGPRDPNSVAPSTKEFNEYHNYGQDSKVSKSMEEVVAEAVAKAVMPLQKSFEAMQSQSAGRKGVFVEGTSSIEKSQKEQRIEDSAFLAGVFTGKIKG